MDKSHTKSKRKHKVPVESAPPPADVPKNPEPQTKVPDPLDEPPCSSIEPLVQKYLCEPILKHIPTSVEPNSISLLHIFVIFTMFGAAIMAQVNDPSWFSFWLRVYSAFAVFASMVLDCLDGMQARRVNKCCPLGEVVDHGFDALTTPLVSGAFALSCNADSYITIFSASLAPVVYIAQLVLYIHTGRFIIPPLDGVGAEAALVGIWLAAAFIFRFVDMRSGPGYTGLWIFLALSSIAQMPLIQFYLRKLTRAQKGEVLQFFLVGCVFGSLHFFGRFDKISTVLMLAFYSFRVGGCYVLYAVLNKTVMKKRYDGWHWGIIAWLVAFALMPYFEGLFHPWAWQLVTGGLPYVFCLQMAFQNFGLVWEYYPQLQKKVPEEFPSVPQFAQECDKKDRAERLMNHLEAPDQHNRLRVLSLNVWGVPATAYRDTRMAAIGHMLSTQYFDIVGLQEVFYQEDISYLMECARLGGLKHTHYFCAGVGMPSENAIGSGLLVCSRYPIVDTLFHRYSVNGKVYKLWQADWFGGKGIGMAVIETPNGPVNFYNTHLVAKYDPHPCNDEYYDHRLCQAFEAAQFIRCTNNAPLAIVAADMNVEPSTLEYLLLVSTANLRDAFLDASPNNPGLTYESKNMFAKIMGPEQGLRIDYLFFIKKQMEQQKGKAWHLSSAQVTMRHFDDRQTGQTLCFSDHWGLLATFDYAASSSSSASSGFDSVCSPSYAMRVFNQNIQTAPMCGWHHVPIPPELAKNMSENEVRHYSMIHALSRTLPELRKGIRACVGRKWRHIARSSIYFACFFLSRVMFHSSLGLAADILGAFLILFGTLELQLGLLGSNSEEQSLVAVCSQLELLLAREFGREGNSTLHRYMGGSSGLSQSLRSRRFGIVPEKVYM